MAFNITPEQIENLNALAPRYSTRTTQDNTGSTAGSFNHLPVELRDKVRWTIAGIFDEWSETTARAENAWRPDAQEELWNRADNLWTMYEEMKAAWGIGA